MLKFIWRTSLLSLFISLTINGQEPSQLRPNILFILVDDLGYHDLGYTGSSFYETPNIDRLASEGMVFTNAYAASPICSPSRAAIMTGKHPAELNITDYIPGNRHYGPHKNQKLASHPFKLFLDPKETTIAEALKENGYSTFFAGKWHLGETQDYFPDKQGFDINLGGNNTGTPSGGYFSPYRNPQLSDGPDGEYLTDRLTDETIKFMSAEKKEPFFAFLSYYTVHLPMQGKPEKVRYYEGKLEKFKYQEAPFVKEGATYIKYRQNMPHYAAMVESLDENIGRLLSALEENGLSENTLVVFTSDNGGMSTSSQTDNIPTSNLPLRAGKGYLYEGGIKVPLILRWPRAISPKTVSSVPVIGTDFFPILLDTGKSKSRSRSILNSPSLTQLLNKETPKDRPLYWYYPHYSGGLGGRPSAAIRLGDYKLIRFFENDHYELYNIKVDPGEQKNVTTVLPKKTKHLKKELIRWMIAMEVKLPFPNPAYKK
ncbi:sulfatase [Arenibacter certesii]|uniref:Sulfatase n=1 Tax=Arenibacter certesii TaxID=228955 RepID=A0A918J4M7_9FLAO|nr:sulfatase [Arenibacter certesii]GGW47843.1 sulfatase [Arenibacter certesii]